ncbi:MAG: helix-turn-helix transcriptional regulator [Hyphomonas sp.]|nr:helix-turn-helix transcriptional regulator [Hyphomonas sp.]
MTLAELGSELGISHQQLQKYETGTNRLSAGMLSNVSDVLRVPIEELFEDTTGKKGGAPDPQEKARNECHALINRTNSPEKLSAMARVLKALATD